MGLGRRDRSGNGEGVVSWQSPYPDDFVKSFSPYAKSTFPFDFGLICLNLPSWGGGGEKKGRM